MHEIITQILSLIYYGFLNLFVLKFWITESIFGVSIAVCLVLKFARKDRYAFERAFLVGVTGIGLEVVFFVIDNWGHLAMH